MDASEGNQQFPPVRNVSDHPLTDPRPLPLHGSFSPTRDTTALLPALTVTEAASSSAPSHRKSSSLGALTSLWTANTSTQAQRIVAPALQEPTLLLALRANSPTNGARRHRAAKSVGTTTTTLSSQPVVVKTYEGSRASSRARSPPIEPPPVRMSGNAKLPTIEEFSFKGILRAVEPEIQESLDAIAEIYARSRLSLAEEHSAHIPPQGEIRDGVVDNRGRRFNRTYPGGLARTLTAVPEASSSSERLAGGSKASSDAGSKGKSSAYGALKNIITGSNKGDASEPIAEASFNTSDSTMVAESENGNPAKDSNCVDDDLADKEQCPPVSLITSPTASKQLSLEAPTAAPTPVSTGHSIGTQTIAAQQRSRAASLTSFASWLPWSRPSVLGARHSRQVSVPRAESRLKDLLRGSSFQKSGSNEDGS